MKKILIVTFDPPKNVGGIEGRGSNYAKFLTEQGHFVEVISFSPEGDFSREDLQGAKLLNFPSSTRRVWKTLRKTQKEISENSIDSIFLLSGALTLYGMLLLYYARRKKKKTLILFYGKDILSSKKNFWASLALKVSPRLAGGIVANSHYTAGLLGEKYSKKTEILHPSVDPGIAKDIIPSTADRKTVLFVGRLVKRKGADDLLKAFSLVLGRISDARLEIVGDGPELDNLEKMASNLGISGKVKFFGRLSGAALYQRYAECSVFVMPSKTTDVDVEGFGTVFLEAAAFAKPSIGTNSGGIPEAIKDGVTGIIVPEGDVQKLALAIERLLSDPKLAHEMGARAKDTLKEFTWERSSAKLVSILDAETM